MNFGTSDLSSEGENRMDATRIRASVRVRDRISSDSWIVGSRQVYPGPRRAPSLPAFARRSLKRGRVTRSASPLQYVGPRVPAPAEGSGVRSGCANLPAMESTAEQ